MRDFNIPTLWNISIHEVYPGHFLHYQHLRQVESKVRKSTFFAPASFVEGWAHYCEQMMVEAGFRRGDATHQARPARRSAGAPGPLRRRHPSALRGSVGGAGDALLPRRGVPRRGDGAARSRARHVRPDLPGLLGRQADDAEAAARLQGAAGRQVLAAGVPRRRARRRAARRSGRTAGCCSAKMPTRRWSSRSCRSTSTSATPAASASR